MAGTPRNVSAESTVNRELAIVLVSAIAVVVSCLVLSLGIISQANKALAMHNEYNAFFMVSSGSRARAQEKGQGK